MKNKLSIQFFLYISILLTGVAFSAVPPSIDPVDNFTVPSGAPARIAAGDEGKIYITDTMKGLVSVFSNNGLFLNDFYIKGSPLGIAADQSGRLYISDFKNKNVGVYDLEGNLIFKLGVGDGEFLLPNDIAVSSTGKVYVSDSKANMVKVYSTDGTLLSTFGSGLLRFPTGIAVDDGAGEVLVIDNKSLYIRIYALTGILKKSIKGNGGGMMGGGNKILRPLGIAFDSTRIYVTDAFHSVVAVYDRESGAFLKYIGNYGTGTLEFKTPTDAVIDRDGKLFVANTNNQRIDVMGIDAYNSIRISQYELNFSVYTKGPSVTQTVDLSSAVTDTAWEATVSEGWVSLSGYSGTTPSSVDVNVDPAGVLPGNYNIEVKFKTSSGTVSLLKLSVEVKMPVLSIAPSSLAFTYRKNSADLPSGSLMISSIGADLPWTGNTTADWLTLGMAAGTTPSSAIVSINNEINKLDLGTYTAYAEINAGVNVIGSPASIGVTVNLIDDEAGDIKVLTNLNEASFTITGPQNFSGSGMSWTELNVKGGTYFISFDHVSGYIRPYSRSFTVESGKTVEINAEYSKKKEITHIVAGAGGITGGELSVINLAGEKVLSIVPFDPAKNPDKNYTKNVRVAVGDLDGKGIDKIVVTDNTNKLKVYSFEGTELAFLSLSKSYRNADIAVGDIDNDGKADILVAVRNSKITSKEKSRVIKTFNYSDGQIQEKPVLFTENIFGEFSIALGDIDGDGIIEAILADLNNVRAFKINTAESAFAQIWSIPSDSKYLPRIAAGDIDDNGVDEIALSITQSIRKKEEKPLINILDGDGKEYGITIDAFGDLGYFKTSTICLGDIDGDGIDEIAAGAGPDSRNGSLIRLFESNGIFMNTTIKAMDSTYGVNVSMGRFAD